MDLERRCVVEVGEDEAVLERGDEQVLSHRFNDVLRILTVFSIVFLPATLIASLWGMNVGLPGGGNPATASTLDFWVVIATSVALIAGMLGFFRYKRWL